MYIIYEGIAFQIDGVMCVNEHFLSLRDNGCRITICTRKLNMYRGWWSELSVTQIYMKEWMNI